MECIDYWIKSGDTLQAIARRHGVTVDVLAQVNGLSELNHIWAGRSLKIPKVRSLCMQATVKTHRVRANDTLAGIAQRYHISVEALAEANGITAREDRLLGRSLEIPKSAQDKKGGLQSAENQFSSTPRRPPALDNTHPNRSVVNNAFARQGPHQGGSGHVSSIKEQEDPPFEWGRELKSFGRVSNAEGVNLRDQPTTTSTPGKRLPFNTHLFVSRELPGDWYLVTLDDGSYGYVWSRYVAIHPPDPWALIHKIKPDEGALEIVRKYYKRNACFWGQDERYYVNILVEANHEKEHRGIYKPYPTSDWDETLTLKDFRIWIPSVEFANSFKGKVSSGSISHEAWQSAKRIATAVGDYSLGSMAFAAGLVHGALESVWDLLTGIVDLVKLLYSVLKSILWGEFLSDLAELWTFAAQLDPKALMQVGVKALSSRWNDDDFFHRWYFRGWLIGYAIAEIVMAVFTGSAALVKWAGKAGKFGELIAKFPKILKLAEKVDAFAKRTSAITKEKLIRAVSRLPTEVNRSVKAVVKPISKEKAVGELASTALQEEKAGSAIAAKEPRIASGVPEDPAPLMRGGVLGERLEDFLAKIAVGGGQIKVGKRAVTATDLAALTKHTGREYALLVLEDDSRILMDMGSYKGGSLPKNTKTLLMHSHPFDYNTGAAKFISEADIDAITYLEQSHSYMVTVDGDVYKFTPSTPADSIGELVRTSHPLEGWVAPTRTK